MYQQVWPVEAGIQPLVDDKKQTFSAKMTTILVMQYLMEKKTPIIIEY